MPLLKKWIENGALFAIWRVEETAEELRKMLVASLPYDEELSQLKSEARQLEYLAVRVLLRAVCGEEKHISHYSSGKPFLTDGSFYITISHTRGYVAVGLHATYEVGVDIEYISNRVRKSCRSVYVSGRTSPFIRYSLSACPVVGKRNHV